jgi:hypothetical protein
MKPLNSFFRLRFIPHHRFALFLLRVWVGFSLFLEHGLEKIAEGGGQHTNQGRSGRYKR